MSKSCETCASRIVKGWAEKCQHDPKRVILCEIARRTDGPCGPALRNWAGAAVPEPTAYPTAGMSPVTCSVPDAMMSVDQPRRGSAHYLDDDAAQDGSGIEYGAAFKTRIPVWR